MAKRNVIKMKVFEGRWTDKHKVQDEFNAWTAEHTGDFDKISIIETHVNLSDGEYVVTVIYRQFLDNELPPF